MPKRLKNYLTEPQCAALKPDPANDRDVFDAKPGHGWSRRWPERSNVRNMQAVMADLRQPPDDEAFKEIGAGIAELERRGHETGSRHGPHP